MAGGAPQSGPKLVLPPKPDSTGVGPAGTGFVGVPDGHTSPASMSDWFKPDRQIIGGGGQLIGAIPRAPMYATGTENAIFDMSAENIARLQGQMALAGLLSKSSKFRVGRVDGTSDPTFAAFKKILTVANTHGNTWEAALNDLIANPVMSAKDREDADGLGGTQTTTSVNLTDPTTAKVILRRTLENELGRAPTASETAQFRTALNDQEELYPSVTTTVTDDEGNAIVTNTGDQAPSPDVFADEFARSGKLGGERNVKRAGVDYFGIAMSSLGAGGGIGG